MSSEPLKHKTRLAYILAASHSGSTLLSMLLNAHKEVGSVGELKITSLGDVNQYRCSCGQKIRDCLFWSSITREMSNRGFDFDLSSPGADIRSGASSYIIRILKPLHRGAMFERLRDLAMQLSPTWKKQYLRIQQTNTALMESVAMLMKKSVIVDSSKIGLRLKYLLRNPSLDVKIIRMIRDGRAVALTYMDPANFADAQNPDLRGGGEGGERDSERLSIDQAAREWRRSNEEAEALLKGVDRSRWIEVRYEELCQAPEDTLKRIFAFLAVKQDAVNLNFRSTEHHIIGNGMRLDDSNRIQLDERWRCHLSKVQISVFDRVAGSKNRVLGYR